MTDIGGGSLMSSFYYRVFFLKEESDQPQRSPQERRA
jgi:hypothetical protein